MQLIKGWYLPDSEKHFKVYLEKVSGNSERAEYQSYQRKISLAYVKESRVAIDIGANIGLWARDICEKFDQVHLFEPYEKNIDCLIIHYIHAVFQISIKKVNLRYTRMVLGRIH